MSEPIRTFEDLECWKACRELRRFITKEVIPVLPREERFRWAILGGQSSVYIPGLLVYLFTVDLLLITGIL